MVGARRGSGQAVGDLFQVALVDLDGQHGGFVHVAALAPLRLVKVQTGGANTPASPPLLTRVATRTAASMIGFQAEVEPDGFDVQWPIPLALWWELAEGPQLT